MACDFPLRESSLHLEKIASYNSTISLFYGVDKMIYFYLKSTIYKTIEASSAEEMRKGDNFEKHLY